MYLCCTYIAKIILRNLVDEKNSILHTLLHAETNLEIYKMDLEECLNPFMYHWYVIFSDILLIWSKIGPIWVLEGVW